MLDKTNTNRESRDSLFFCMQLYFIKYNIYTKILNNYTLEKVTKINRQMKKIHE